MAKTKSSHVALENTNSIERDDLAQLIVDTANKSMKDGSKVAYFLDEQEDPSMVTDWVSTGSTLLDLAISNRANGGLPVGRIVELNGLEGTGKSLICAHIIAETQKKNGIGVMIDTENAAAPAFWKAVGVNLTNLPYLNLFTVEEIFNYIEQVIGIVRKSNKNKLVTIVVDSLAMASCETEMESVHGKDGYNTSKAIIISKALRKITGLIGKERILVVFTNQLRMNMSAMAFGDKWVVPGGKAMGFAASVRIRMVNKGQLVKGSGPNKEIIGNKCLATVTKNRMGPPKRSAEFEIHFDSGVQDLTSWYKFAKEKKIIGEMQSKSFLEKIQTDPDYKNDIYNKICDKVIMTYKDANSKIDEDVEVTDAEDED